MAARIKRVAVGSDTWYQLKTEVRELTSKQAEMQAADTPSILQSEHRLLHGGGDSRAAATANVPASPSPPAPTVPPAENDLGAASELADAAVVNGESGASSPLGPSPRRPKARAETGGGGGGGEQQDCEPETTGGDAEEEDAAVAAASLDEGEARLAAADAAAAAAAGVRATALLNLAVQQLRKSAHVCSICLSGINWECRWTACFRLGPKASAGRPAEQWLVLRSGGC